MFESYKSDQSLRRQVFALKKKLRELQASSSNVDQRAAWKLGAKIKGIQNEMDRRHQLTFSWRL